MQELIFVRFSPRQGCLAQVEEVLRVMVAKTRREPGCLQYDLYRIDDSGQAFFHLLERYNDEAALQAHRGSDYFREYRAAITPLLEEPPLVKLLAPVDVAQ